MSKNDITGDRLVSKCYSEQGRANHDRIFGKKKRVVMCQNNWPEPEAEDFKVFDVRDGETDEEAIARAAKSYSPESRFYITEEPL